MLVQPQNCANVIYHFDLQAFSEFFGIYISMKKKVSNNYIKHFHERKEQKLQVMYNTASFIHFQLYTK